MKLKINILSALAILVATALSAQAQTPFGTNASDIIVGFKTGSAGTFASDLDIAAGNISTLSTYTTTTLIGNFNASLTAAFGSTWNSNVPSANLLNWGAAGTDNTNTIDYLTKSWSAAQSGTLGVASTTAFSGISSGLGTMSASIFSIGQGYQTGTAAANPGAVTNLVSALNSWTKKVTAGTNAFATSNVPNSAFGNKMAVNPNATFGGFAASASDLYSYQGTNSTFLGTFSLATNGNLYFTAIPEPSTYAAILGVATLGFAAIRRRKQQIDAQV